MRYAIIITLIFLLQSCKKSDTPVSAGEDTNYKIVFISDRDSDGRQHIELGTECEIYTMNPDGSEQIRLTVNDLWDKLPKYSPNGSKIAYTSFRDWLMPEIFIMDTDGKNQQDLGEGQFVCFSPGGSRILFQTGGLIGIMNSNGTNKQILTQWVDSISSTAGQDYPVQFSPDGSKILVNSSRGNNNDIYIMGTDGSNIKRLTDDAEYESAFSFSPDNSKILYSSYKDNKPQIYVMDSNGSNKTQLTSSGINSSPSFSPDGKQIAYISGSGDFNDIYIMNADGSNQQKLTNSNSIKSTPYFSPDGQSIVFDQWQNQKSDIFRIKIKTGEIINLTRGMGNNRQPSFRTSMKPD